MAPIAGVHRAAEAEQLRFPDGSAMQLLADAGADPSSAGLSFHRTALRPGAVGASPHHHRTAPEIFYVLSGTIRFLVGDDVTDAGAGDLVTVGIGVDHAFAAGTEGAEVLVVTPRVPRAEMFRRYAGRAAGDAHVEAVTAAESASRFDTYASSSPAWDRSLAGSAAPASGSPVPQHARSPRP